MVGISLIQWKDTSSHHSVPEAARTQASRRAVSQGWAFTGSGMAGLGGCLILGGPHPVPRSRSSSSHAQAPLQGKHVASRQLLRPE